MSGNEFVEVEGDYLNHTADAILVQDSRGEQHWLPRLCIDTSGTDLSELQRGEPIEFLAQEWLADREGLT